MSYQNTYTNLGTVLIVDDTPLNLRLLGNMLKKNGFVIQTADTGQGALDMMQNPPLPDLILLDIKLTDLSGYEVAEKLKTDVNTRDIPIIFISALNDTDDIVRAFEVGGVDYVTKPFQLREVRARVQSQLTLAQQRRQIQDLRERDRQYYERIGKMRDQFIYAATHDLKNPLSQIDSYASMLRTNEAVAEDDEAQVLIRGIQQGAQKMRSLVMDMLELAQIQSSVELSIIPMSLTAFLSDCMTEFSMQARNKKIDMVFSPPDDDVLVPMDDERMERVVINLISNAIKYTPEGGRVEVAAFHKDGHAVIDVIDTGYGIPEKSIPHLFDAFYRVRGKPYTEVEGTGLGLSVAKTIVEKHGGQIEVASIVDKGSTFRVILPLQASASEID